MKLEDILYLEVEEPKMVQLTDIPEGVRKEVVDKLTSCLN